MKQHNTQTTLLHTDDILVLVRLFEAEYGRLINTETQIKNCIKYWFVEILLMELAFIYPHNIQLFF